MRHGHEAWLRLTVEDPLDTDLPICDPHHHLWDRPNDRYFLEDLLPDISGGHRIMETVYVECGSKYRVEGPPEMRPVGETEFVEGVAAETASGKHGHTRVAAGIVGFADMTLGAAVAPVLEAHIAAAKGRFRGIRHICTWDASPDIISRAVKGLLLDAKFREGYACLKTYGLSFDAWLFQTQLMELVDLAKAFPDTVITVEHTGGPLGIGPYAGRRSEVFREWKLGMAALATCPNVVVKLGGLGIPWWGFTWRERARPPSSTELAAALTPYYAWCIEQFGVDRCMFESNFPGDKRSYSYTVLWNAFKQISRDCSAEDRSALFRDTAVRVYRLAAA